MQLKRRQAGDLAVAISFLPFLAFSSFSVKEVCAAVRPGAAHWHLQLREIERGRNRGRSRGRRGRERRQETAATRIVAAAPAVHNKPALQCCLEVWKTRWQQLCESAVYW